MPAGIPALDAAAQDALATATHLIAVTTADWDQTPATVTLYTRSESAWQRAQGPYPAVVGHAGMSWGRGLTQPPPGSPRIKHEGDGTAPAGLFRLGTIMGYAPTPPAGASLPYAQASPQMVCVDDPSATTYNSIQTAPSGIPPPWSSSEDMRRTDDLYELLALVNHNGLLGDVKPIPGGGSCIFLHVWGGAGSQTAGCTAMDLGALTQILTTLTALDTTVMVQLPAAEYALAAPYWGLPLPE